MPELPEVEHFRRMLLPLVAGSQQAPLQLELVKGNPPKKFISPEEIAHLNNSQCIVKDIRRRGKLICMDLTLQQQNNGSKERKSYTQQQQQPNKFLFIHMGMTGRITTPTQTPCFGHAASKEDGQFLLHGSIKQQQQGDTKQQQHEYPPKYTYLRFRAGNHDKDDDGEGEGVVVAAAAADACFSDPRKFGKVYLADSDAEFESLSPDGLCEFIDPSPLIGLSTGIKAVLLDQKRVVSGVGNWVADEILYQTEIHPDQTFLTESQAAAVQACLVDVLTTAVACLEAHSEYPLHWLFHYRWAKKKDGVKDAKGRTIKFITSGGRTSAVIPSIQKQAKSQKRTGAGDSKRVTSAKGSASNMKQKGKTARVVSNPVNNDTSTLNGSRKRKPPSSVPEDLNMVYASARRRSSRLQAAAP